MLNVTYFLDQKLTDSTNLIDLNYLEKTLNENNLYEYSYYFYQEDIKENNNDNKFTLYIYEFGREDVYDYLYKQEISFTNYEIYDYYIYDYIIFKNVNCIMDLLNVSYYNDNNKNNFFELVCSNEIIATTDENDNEINILKCKFPKIEKASLYYYYFQNYLFDKTSYIMKELNESIIDITPPEKINGEENINFKINGNNEIILSSTDFNLSYINKIINHLGEEIEYKFEKDENYNFNIKMNLNIIYGNYTYITLYRKNAANEKSNDKTKRLLIYSGGNDNMENLFDITNDISESFEKNKSFSSEDNGYSINLQITGDEKDELNNVSYIQLGECENILRNY